MVEEESSAAWDEVCFNPHGHALESGREEGREAGLAAGFNDGYTVGIVKGIEFGMEVGFIRGVLQVVVKEYLSCKEKSVLGDSSQRERIEKTASSLSKLLEDFPSPAQVFRNKQDDANQLELDGFNNDSEEATSSSSSADLERHMQDIRAKFKLLTVQLRWKNYSLKSLMDATKMSNDAEPLKNQTTDW